MKRIEIPLRVKETREKLQITQQEFAALLGVAVSTVARWETGVSVPSRMAVRLMEMVAEDALIIICAWCGKSLGTKDGKGQTGISHGICPECAELVRKK